MIVNWSDEFPFEPQMIRDNVPAAPGVYEILQSESYARYRETTNT